MTFRLRFALSLFVVLVPFAAQATLTVTPITWNVIGLDSNNPTAGPHLFPVGARVCSNVATTNVAVNFVFDSANANVNLRAGSLSSLTLASIGAGQCADAYFEVDVTQTAAAFDTTRRYHITATDVSGTASTPTPRELYVEHLISQNRNSVTDVKVGPVGGPYTSVPAGGSMSLVVGNSYDIQLLGGTATQGYNQFEEFINFPNTIFQVQKVVTTYSADDSPYVPNPNDKLYADACLWQNDPNSPAYRACVGGDFKAGGNNVVTTYTVKIISGGGTSQTLGSLLYDFSGSSYHYNSDYGVGARIAVVIDPASANISKSFTPNPAVVNGVSVLTFTLTNPNGAPLSGYNFVDNLPANLLVATPNGVTTSGCGTPTVTATAGSGTISFSNGTLAGGINCVVKVNVTPATTGSFPNTTNYLFVGSVDTGHTGSDTLTVNAASNGTGLCGVTMANWSVPNGTTANPPDLAGGVPTVKAANVSTATLAANVPADTAINTSSGHTDTTSWSTFGYKTAGQFVTFTLDTTNYTAVQFGFWMANPSPANGPTQVTVTVNSGAGFGAPVLTINSPAAAFTHYTVDLTGLTNTSGNTLIRVTGTGANNDASGASLLFDDMLFTGCTSASKPTITKAFSPNPIAVNGVSTLTFTLTNPNTANLTGAGFTDALPSGVQVAATPAASTTCAGATWAPAAGNTSLTFSGGTIPGSGSCTASVNVTATSAGPHANVSGTLSTTEAGTSTTPPASATLTAVLPPSIAKEFAPNPVLPNGVSTLTFTIANPNQNDALSGVAFADTFPTSPGAMVVASTPAASTSGCGSPVFAPAAGAGAISFSGGTIAGGGTCTVTVNVTTPVAGTYNNTSGNVSHVVNAQTINGNTASGSLTVNPPNPAIHLLKQVNSTGTGLFFPYLATAVGGNVYYRFTVENTGDVAITSPQLADNAVNVSTCNGGWTGVTLQPGDVVTCVVGPIAAVSGSHINTATVSAMFLGNPVNSPQSAATYATEALSLVKSATETTFTLAGDVLHYSYLVTNSGFATLAGPITVSDNKTTVTCPPVTTVGDLDNFLDPGESITCTATYTVTGSDVTAAQVTNTATAGAADPDTAAPVNSNQSSKTVPLSTSADVSLSKTLTTAGPYAPGQSISYTIVVANGGPSTATSIQVTDTPTNLSITNVSGSGCSALPCTIASLASGANTTITVTATITAAGAFDNSATATAAEPDPNTANNTDNTGNGGTATPSADVSIVKTLTDTSPYHQGDTVTFTLVVHNAGPSTATSVQVTDTPTNLAITNVSGAGCSALPCTIASLANGADATITVTATVSGTGAFSNAASVTATETDPNTNNNSSSDGSTASTSADVSIAKTLNTAGPYHVGDTLSYTLVVHNAGPSVATSIQVTDTPTNLTLGTVSGACSSLPCTIASLAVNADATINVSATIPAVGAFDNVATANGTDFDPDPSNNTDSTNNGGTAAASADVSLVKTLTTVGPFTVGQSISYTMVIHNAGPSIATSIQVTDTPANLTITNVSGDCSAFPCTIASLAVGADANVAVTATIDAAGAFDNSATATPAEFDPNTANNTDNTGNGGSTTSSVDVSLTKTLNTAGPYHAGDTLSYTLLVHNAGPATATSIQVTDTPTNLTLGTVSGACSSLPCTIASLANGADATINVTATIIAAGAFDNSATATPAETDTNTANNTDNTGNGGTAAASADVSIVKTLVTAGPYHAGQTISYTLVVANAGPSTATSIQVTDTPANMTIGTVSGACAALPCTIASLASGANTTINVTATITAAGAFDNTATATPAEFDPNTSNNTDSTGNGGTAVAAADVSIVKTLTTAGPYHAGQSISYTLVVANAGPSTATSIQVTDTPTNMTIDTVSGSGCSALPCTIASLASGANTTINVSATITAAGAFDNTATATPAELDPNTSNNTDSTGNGGTALGSADVSIVKTLVTAGPYSAGQTISYTLVVANAGPSTATSIQVTDTPTNMVIGTVSGACSSLPCTIASLASGANTTINVAATITAAGAFDNTATATPAELDPNTANNTDSTGNGGTAAASADVSIVKTLVTSGPYLAGQTISYTLVVANAGPSPATNILVVDSPANMTIGTVSGACSSLPCTIASLASGANTTINVTATITAAGAFDNSATATASEPDPNGGNNTDNTGNGGTAANAADVSMTKTLTTAGPYTQGQSISYTLVVANAGPSSATSIQVTDTPTNLTITNVSGACTALPCTIASLASGANTTINVTATITATGAFDNSATATATEADPNPTNNTDNTGNGGTTGAPSADLSLVKTLITAGPFAPGQSIAYTIVVHNAGPSTATSVQITDTPTNLTITNVSGACTALPCTLASLGNGANATINVTATIAAAGAFDNSANATAAESDPNTADNTDNTGNGGTAASTQVDLSIVKTASNLAVSKGGTLDYTLTVHNNGPGTATSVVVSDSLPSGFTLISATPTQGTCSGATNVSCSLGTMVNGATVTITLHGTATAQGALVNTASVAAAETETVTTNNTSTAIVNVINEIPTLSEWALMALAMLLALAGASILRR